MVRRVHDAGQGHVERDLGVGRHRYDSVDAQRRGTREDVVERPVEAVGVVGVLGEPTRADQLQVVRQSKLHIPLFRGCQKGERERNVLFNDALNTFYLRLYGVRHMVKDHSDSERGNPLSPHRLLLSINSKGSFICTIPQTG